MQPKNDWLSQSSGQGDSSYHEMNDELDASLVELLTQEEAKLKRQ